MLAGLLLKDLCSLKKTLKLYLLMVTVFVAAAILSGNGSSGVNMFAAYVNTLLTILGINLLLQTFTTDEACGWVSYCLTLPLERKDIVKSKYLFAGVMYLTSLAAALVMAIGIYVMQGQSILDTLSAFFGGSFVVVLITMILLPVIFKYNSEKSRMVLMGVVAIPAVFILLAGNVLEPEIAEKLMNIIKKILPYIDILKVVLPAVLLVIIYISYRTSVAIFNKKEL